MVYLIDIKKGEDTLKKNKRVKINKNKISLVLSLIFMLTIGSVILLNSGIFKVNIIEIKGNKECSKEEILKYSDVNLNKNIFKYKIKDIEKNIKKNSYIDSVIVERKIPNKIIVTVKERKAVAILQNNDKKYYIDKKGNILKRFTSKSQDSMVLKIDYDIDKEQKLKLENEQTKKRLFYLLECLKKHNVNKQIENVDLRNKDNIIIATKSKVKMILPNNDKLDYNISRLNSILVDLQSKNITRGTVNLNYDKCAIYTPE